MKSLEMLHLSEFGKTISLKVVTKSSEGKSLVITLMNRLQVRIISKLKDNAFLFIYLLTHYTSSSRTKHRKN